jgi:hypothetical protein
VAACSTRWDAEEGRPVVWAAEEGWLSRAAFTDSKILGQDAALARTLTDAYTPAGSAKSPTRMT